MKDLVGGMVVDPDDGIVFLNQLNEKQLTDLLFRQAKKIKSIRSRHWKKHGYLLDMNKVLIHLYSMNVHRWGIDEGIPREQLEDFERYFNNE
jgi:hypothetical protein